MPLTQTVTAIVPCNDLDASEAFYARLGFFVTNRYEGYRILSDGKGAALHLTNTVEGWVVPARNPFGIYLYARNVDQLAKEFAGQVIAGVGDKPWGMYEFAISDPNGTLVRIGWPSGEPR